MHGNPGFTATKVWINKFLCILPVAVAQSSSDGVAYVMYLRF